MLGIFSERERLPQTGSLFLLREFVGGGYITPILTFPREGALGVARQTRLDDRSGYTAGISVLCFALSLRPVQHGAITTANSVCITGLRLFGGALYSVVL